MMFDDNMKKGDKVIHAGKVYEINHTVLKCHEKVCVWVNKKSGSWDLIDKKLVQRMEMESA